MSSWKSGKGREALPEVQQRLGGPPRSLEGVGRLSRWSARGREALPDVREESGGFKRPSRK